MYFSYRTKGVCASQVQFDVEDGVIKNLQFVGGCEGSHRGISALAEGMMPEEASKRLKGITCGMRTTSCPDQLSQAIDAFLAEQ